MGSNACVCRIACGSGSNYGGNAVNEVAQQEKMMTTKELAEVLGVGESTVKRAVEKVRPVLGEVAKNSQGGYLFNEEQATAIKLEIQKHHNLQSRQIDTVSTETEENLIVMQAVAILQRKARELEERAAMAEQVVHRIADGTGCYTMNQAAKALKLPYGNIKLFERLRNEGLLNLDNTPTQKQVNQGNFKVIVKHVNDKVGNKVVTLVTGKGLVYLAKRFNTEIDPAVQADVRG
jgi:phage antirepressor YoqD-like protein